MIEIRVNFPARYKLFYFPKRDKLKYMTEKEILTRLIEMFHTNTD